MGILKYTQNNLKGWKSELVENTYTLMFDHLFYGTKSPNLPKGPQSTGWLILLVRLMGVRQTMETYLWACF